jgi:hypothetical protein
MASLFQPGNATDPIYAAFRDNAWNKPRRELIESMWAKFEPYCPDTGHFLEEVRRNFIERTWEMYLACVLLDRGFVLRKTEPKGPDICILDGERRIWVEATAPKPGTGPDAVPPRAARGRSHGSGGWSGVPPSSKILALRYTSALDAKRKKVIAYRKCGIVKPSEPYIIAINIEQIEDAEAFCDDGLGVPIGVGALFGIGEPFLRVPLYSDEEATAGNHVQLSVAKRSGTKIPTQFFASNACPEVSGVFCTCTGIIAAPKCPGAEVIFANNPFADAKIAPGTFKFGTEYVSDTEYLNPPVRHDKIEH